MSISSILTYKPKGALLGHSFAEGLHAHLGFPSPFETAKKIKDIWQSKLAADYGGERG